jgi:mono/diheme cytochrome c family protein
VANRRVPGSFAALATVALVVWAVTMLTAQQKRASEPSADAFDRLVKPFITQNCITCHGNEKHKRDLNFEAIATSPQTLLDDHDRWDMVVQKLRDREMPPEDEEQPPEHQRQAVATWIAEQLDHLDRVTPADPGRVTARRLNRAEYNNTVRDLLGVDLQPAEDFPQDDAGYGFDNIGDVLSLSPALMEKYMTAAERVSRAAIFGVPKMDPTLTRLRSNGRRTPETREFPSRYDVTGLSLPNAFHATTRIPADGQYLFKVSLGGVRPAGSEPITVTLWIDGKESGSLVFDQDKSARFDDDRQDFGGQAVQFRATLTSGEHWIAAAIPRVFEGLPPRLGGPNPSTRPDPPPKPFKPPASATPERIEQMRKNYEETQAFLKKIPLDGVRIANVDIGGPYAQVTGPSATSLARVYTCGHAKGQPHQPWCATRIMTNLARRAFRRPVTPAEVEKYVTLVRQAQKDEHSFEEGLAVGIQALLVSPDFLFRIERNRPLTATASAAATASATSNASTQRLTQHELATRLSYFLWASMPDEPLRRAADAGTLREPAVLEAQVRRMLHDPKSHALADQFGGQWLEFRALESVSRDKDKFPDFDDYLRLSMRRETELFIEHLIQDDRSILDFITANYSFLNERLARHYGIDGVSGPEFRRVDLTGTPRGGVLTQGSVLTVSSYATRTSPVLRGKWILENLLNAPPPSPPADVPNLEDTKIGTEVSMREQLTAHRRDPTCAVCHKRMDPLGFGLENFDAIGKWRTADGNFPVDAHGTLPDGSEFDGPAELRGILSKQQDAFARAITSKLLTYALGRGLEKYDSLTVRRIAGKLPQADYRFSALVLEIVNSAPFQYRRPVQDARDPASTQKGTK